MTTTQTQTIAEFLLARIAEDEADARGAGSGSWDALDGGVTDLDAETWPVTSTETPDERRVRLHIARHDPARVLAECEAKRRIMDSAMRHVCFDSFGAIDEEEGPIVLRALASVYADHPDYRPEWRP